MEFKRKGPDVAEVRLRDGRRILFSYGEPVAVLYHPGISRTGKRVDAFVSRTTERHIAEFAAGAALRRVPAGEIRAIVAEVS